jgi:hypothetical protein
MATQAVFEEPHGSGHYDDRQSHEYAGYAILKREKAVGIHQQLTTFSQHCSTPKRTESSLD